MIELSWDIIDGHDVMTLLEKYEGYIDGDKRCLVLKKVIKNGN